ncbi:hypothetical protein GCM10007216_19040 [Thalassobacillus devorans]|uniref:Uncharacterized protein n=1 Tax=Thalassobacillus devorans TaxID=279813 RepID=A0ABQ1P0J2_9BACI|nr:hypothetical protein [Thalassobacillus devorans]NIK28153.1 hypothetical protein [Thalassobacillus devorans]GGC88492.1 hypothetical protein GCM10007216_19040 [Thalassobacillus devorans]
MYNYHEYPMWEEEEWERNNAAEVKDLCQTHNYYFVQVQMSDGSLAEGIIDGTDEDNVYMLVPAGDDMDEQRQFGYSGFGGGYGGYPFGGGYGYPRRFRRFRRFRYPFFSIRRLFFPFFY